MATQKVMAQLVDGTEVPSTKDGWDPKDAGRVPVMATGWKIGNAPHFSISMGLLLACKDKVEGAYIGEFAAEDGNGKEVLVPVMDGKVVMDDMVENYITARDLDVQVVRIATNRSGGIKELKGLAANPKVMEALKTADPEAYEKLLKYMDLPDPTEEPAEAETTDEDDSTEDESEEDETVEEESTEEQKA